MDKILYANERQVDSRPPEREVMVWDLPLRLFHWSMVGVVSVAAATGFFAPTWWLDVHVAAGYSLAVLLAFRLVWGFFGSYYSRFRTFPLSRDGLTWHLRQVLGKKSPAFLGHNPIGTLVIAVLLLTLVSLVVSGLLTLGGKEKLGPLAFMTTYNLGIFAKEFHGAAAGLLVGVVAVHLLGVVAETRIFRHRVVRAMITGKKVTLEDYPVSGNRQGLSGRLALSLMAPAALIAAGLMLSDKTPLGWRSLKFPAVYAGECGECHDAYHPSLRNAGAWRALVAGLSDHYGEDASLGKNATDSIGRFLENNGAGTFDTEVAHRVGRQDTASLRMTDSRFWRRRHREIDKSVFRMRAVGSKVNCNSCHMDARSGRFDNVKINPPTGDKK